MSLEEQSITRGMGTQKFMAPEVIDENEEYDEKVDVYSFGVLLFYILNGGEMPKIRVSEILRGKKAPIPDSFTILSKNIINECWNYDAKDRPSFEKILDDLDRNNYNLINLTKTEIDDVKIFVNQRKEKIPSYCKVPQSTLSSQRIENRPQPIKNKKDSKSKDKKDSKFNIQTFELQNQRSFNGIFNYLTSKTGGNISDNGTIEVSSNSINRIQTHPKYLLQESNYYAAESGRKDAYVLFDFKKMKVEITNYTIKASATCCMKNWVFEVSDDGFDWKIIDQHTNSSDLATKDAISSFKVQKNGFSRFCRIRHNGEFIDYGIHSVMIINRVEFYGKLKSQFT